MWVKRMNRLTLIILAVLILGIQENVRAAVMPESDEKLHGDVLLQNDEALKAQLNALKAAGKDVSNDEKLIRLMEELNNMRHDFHDAFRKFAKVVNDFASAGDFYSEKVKTIINEVNKIIKEKIVMETRIAELVGPFQQSTAASSESGSSTKNKKRKKVSDQ